MVSGDMKKQLERKQYRLFGNSAVQICNWTKNSLLDKGCCYKEKFYGISSHRCCQMSPFISCPNKCIHCWRPIKLTEKSEEEIKKPEEIIEKSIENQRKLLTGFKGNKNINMKKLEEARNPNQFAISLIGEPTLHSKLGRLIQELRKRKIKSFLVTNGLYPEAIKKLKENNQLPTQLYISLNSPNKEEYEKWHQSKLKDAWERFNKSLDLMKKLKTRKVIRLTLMRKKNMKKRFLEGFARLIKKANPDFVEVKSFMSIGEARKRYGYDKMPSHKEIEHYSKLLLKFLPKYKFLDEQIESRVVLLGKDKKKMKIKESGV